MKLAFTTLGVMVLMLVSYLTINYSLTSRIEQEVTENKHDIRMIAYDTPCFFPMSIYSRIGDSTQCYHVNVKIKEDSVRREKLMIDFNAPYILTTTYKDETIIDYGSYREIDSLKCIRYNEMLLTKIIVDSLLIAEQNIIERTNTELKSLNKSCN